MLPTRNGVSLGEECWGCQTHPMAGRDVGHMGSRLSRRKPTTCDRGKAGSQDSCLPSARLCLTSHPMESWHQGAFVGAHTWGGVAHVERCIHVCAHVHACVHLVCMLQECGCLCVCA